MNILGNKIPLSQLKVLYDDVELAILFDWLQINRPASLRSINIETVSDDTDETAGPIRLIHDMYARYGNFALSNAVARLVLSDVQGRLPQWAAVYEDGRVELARTYTPKRRAGKLDTSLPVHDQLGRFRSRIQLARVIFYSLPSRL